MQKLMLFLGACLAAVSMTFGAWFDNPIVARVDAGYAGNFAYYMNLSEDGRYLMVNLHAGKAGFPVRLYDTADLNAGTDGASGLVIGEAFGDGSWKGGAISSKLGLMIPGSSRASGADYVSLSVPAKRWTPNVSAFSVSGLSDGGIDGMDFNPAGTVLYCNQSEGAQNKVFAYPTVDLMSAHSFGVPTEYIVSAVRRIRNVSVYAIGDKDIVYFGEGDVANGPKAVYALDPSTGFVAELVSDELRFVSNIMNVKVSGAGGDNPLLYVQTYSSGLYVYALAKDGMSVVSATPVKEFTAAEVAELCGSTVACNVASFEVSPDGRYAYLMGLSSTGLVTPVLTVIKSDWTSGAKRVDAKTLDGTEAFAVTEDTVVSELTLTADSTVQISAGVTLSVEKLVGSFVLTKKGLGALNFGKDVSADAVVIAQGVLGTIGCGTPIAAPSVTKSALLHVDASDASSISYSADVTADRFGALYYPDETAAFATKTTP